MQLEYIEENLNTIIQNPNNVLYLRPYDIGNKRALFAVVRENQGVYKKVQITKEQSKLTFPFEPLYWFYNGPGYYYLKNFLSFHNWLALNTTNLDGFRYKELDNNKKQVGIFATFNDGSATFVTRKKAKEFQKNGGIESYINLLEKYKDYNPKHDNYQIIEYYSNSDDTFIIPELQEKTEEQAKVKALTKDN